jgi:hypothetical protein
MSYPAVPNLAGFSVPVLQAMFSAYQTEVMRRMSGGSVQSGGSSGESYSMTKLSDDALYRLGNAITDALGLDTQMNFVRPDFSYGSGASNQTSTGVVP